MDFTTQQIKLMLLVEQAIPPDVLDAAIQKAQMKGMGIERSLVESGHITDAQLGKIFATYLELPFIELSKEHIDDLTLRIIPEKVAAAQHAIAFHQDQKSVYVATSNINYYLFQKFLEKKTMKSVVVHYATPFAIKTSLKYYKRDLSERVKAFEDSIIMHGKEEQVVDLVNLLIEYAYELGASDIHLEPLIDRVAVRFRVDGVLHEVVSYPKTMHDKVVFRLKILAKLRTDEHETAQDGRFSFRGGDLRVSILPITNGENIVLRILLEGSQRFVMEELGLSPKDLEKLNRAASKPYGMILTAGPTGSGKTTTVYAVLQILNKPEVNIITIEDPVEYEVAHVQQTQVNVKKNLTFSTGLRSILRQDPNVIMVGEIRDNETADIAINAAMTGHLMLSTLHANDAGTVIPRLYEMGIEPFLIASSLNIIIAQRLVRKLCDFCKKQVSLDDRQIKAIQDNPILMSYVLEETGKTDLVEVQCFRGEGCKECNNSGYKDRTAIFEVMEITDDIRLLITQRSSADVITKQAIQGGMTPIMRDGVSKVFQGVTSIDEVIRVTDT